MGLFDFLGGGSSGGSTTTGSQTNTPWSGIAPYLTDTAGQAAWQYGQATPQNQVWQGPRYIDPTNLEVDAMQGLTQTARQNTGLPGRALDQWRQQLGTGGLAGQNPALTQLDRIQRGNLGIGTGGQYQGMFNQFGGPSSAEQNLGAMARGELIGRSNPHVMEALDMAAEKAGHAVGSIMNGAGRYGSPGAHQGTLAREVGNIYSTGLRDQVNRDIANQMGASGAIDQARQGYGGMQLSALGGRTGVEGANIANRAGAAGQYSDTLFRGADNAMRYGLSAPAIDEMRYANDERLLQIGAAQRGELQQENAANQQYFNEMRDAPYGALSRYTSIINGSPGGAAGFGTATSTVPQGSALLGAAGGAMSGAQLGGMFGAPWLGAAAGGIFGALS
jgi:hypothetical protein